MTSTRRQWLQRLGWLAVLAATRPARAAQSRQWDALKARIRDRYPTVPQLPVAALHAWLQDAARPRPLLLDTRTAEEFADGHIEGAVRVDSVSEAMRRLSARPAGTTAVLYCSVGYRSSAMLDALQAKGATSIYNLEGSLFEWANAGYAVIADDGRRGKVHPYDRKWGALLRRDLWSREP